MQRRLIISFDELNETTFAAQASTIAEKLGMEPGASYFPGPWPLSGGAGEPNQRLDEPAHRLEGCIQRLDWSAHQAEPCAVRGDFWKVQPVFHAPTMDGRVERSCERPRAVTRRLHT